MFIGMGQTCQHQVAATYESCGGKTKNDDVMLYGEVNDFEALMRAVTVNNE
jgi:hypothetical protein